MCAEVSKNNNKRFELQIDFAFYEESSSAQNSGYIGFLVAVNPVGQFRELKKQKKSVFKPSFS